MSSVSRNCVLLVVGMFCGQKTAVYDYSNLDCGLKIMFIGKELFILRVWAKNEFYFYEILKVTNSPDFPRNKKFPVI